MDIAIKRDRARFDRQNQTGIDRNRARVSTRISVGAAIE